MNKKFIIPVAIAAAAGLLLWPICANAKKKKPAEPMFGDITTKVHHPEWMGNAVIYEVNLRQGTAERNLRGMQKELPRLKDLGVDILWLMPIHPISEVNRKGELGSYYAVQDYKQVNPEFGTIDDLKEFVRTAHGLGMYVILDEVCNHTGCDNVWLEVDPARYALDKEGKKFGPFDWTDTYKLDYSNPSTRAAMIDALKFWIEECDIDGYRCDVAGEVPTDFWNEARPQLQALKPIFMLAESSKPELLVEAFDADYNWPMKDVFNAIAATQGVNQYAKDHDQKLPQMNAQSILELLNTQRKQYSLGGVSMNMVTNHDLNSWEGTEFERLGASLGAFAVLSYTLPGMPMMYTGQEVGFNHAFEFFKADDEQPDYTSNEFTAFYEMLNALKHNHPALNAANLQSLFTNHPSDNPNVIAFTRSTADDKVIVVANLSTEIATLNFAGQTPETDNLINYFTGAPAELPSTLQPWEFLVLTQPI